MPFELSDEVAEIKAQQKQATEIRAEEKKTNTVTIADAKVAQAAVEKATTVLKEFYSSVAAGAALAAAFTAEVNAPPYNADPTVLPVDVCGLDGVAERGMAVLEIGRDGFHVQRKAPTTFEALTN